jgi:hypothetical protein
MVEVRGSVTNREKLLGMWIRGRSIADIAQELQLSHGAITSALTEARRKGDPRAVYRRRRRAELEFSMMDSRRGSLLRIATHCLEFSGAVDERELESLLQMSGQTSARTTSRRPRKTTAAFDDKGSEAAAAPSPAHIIAVQRAAHIANRLPPGDALPYPVELAEELGALTESPTRVPAAWFDDLAGRPCVTTTGAYALGEALFTLVELADSTERYHRLAPETRHVRHAIRELYSIAVQSPRIGARAVHLLGRLGVLALDPTGQGHQFLSDVLYDAPLGYRAMRVASRLLFEPRTDMASTESWLHSGVEDRVMDLLHTVHRNPPDELYPERSFTVETLFKMSPDERDGGARDRQVVSWLSQRALDEIPTSSRPFRERAYAAVALASRDHTVADEVRRSLSSGRPKHPGNQYLCDQMSIILDDALPDDPSKMPELPEMPGGVELTVVRQAIEHAMGTIPAPRVMPGTGVGLVVPPEAFPAVASLMRCALADLHGTRRRRALDTLRHAGLGSFVATAAISVLRNDGDNAPEWLRAQSAFAISFSHHSAAVEPLVQQAALAVSRGQTELAMTCLHGLGDMGLHVSRHGNARSELVDLSRTVADSAQGDPHVLRGLAYALASTRTSGTEELRDIDGELNNLANAADPLTRRVARWGQSRHRRRQAPEPVDKNPDVWDGADKVQGRSAIVRW